MLYTKRLYFIFQYLKGNNTCRYNGQKCGATNFTEVIKVAGLCMEFNSYDKDKGPLVTQTEPYG